jgi:tetratricopeptide (TPR) repeat protein
MKTRFWLTVLGITALVVGQTAASALMRPDVTFAASLEDQLDIQPNNATGGASRDVADEWMAVGNQKLAEGAYNQAIAAWQEAADIYQTLGDIQGQARAYSAISSTFAQLGAYPQAEQAIRRRIAIARDSDDLIGASYGLNNLGTLYLNRGRLDPAQEIYTEALRLAQQADHNGSTGLSFSNLGLVALQRQDYEAAAKLLETATNYRYLAGDYLGEANSSNTLGDVYIALGRNNNAIGAYRVALRAGAEAEDRARQLRARDGLLEIYFEQQAWQTVLEYLNLRRELTLAAAEPDVQTVVTLRWLGDYYYIQGDVSAAEQAYSRGLGLARALETPSLEAELTNRILGL